MKDETGTRATGTWAHEYRIKFHADIIFPLHRELAVTIVSPSLFGKRLNDYLKKERSRSVYGECNQETPQEDPKTQV